jgi:hypothetical protein
MIHVFRIPLTPFFRKNLTMHQAVAPFAGVFNNITTANIKGVLYRARQASVKTTWMYTSHIMQPLPAASKDVRELLLPSTLSHEVRGNLTHSQDGYLARPSLFQARQRGPHAVPFCVTGSPSFDEKRTHRQQQCTSLKRFRRKRLYKVEELLLHSKPLLFHMKFNVHGSVHRNNILIYKSQQDAHVTEFI